MRRGKLVAKFKFPGNFIAKFSISFFPHFNTCTLTYFIFFAKIDEKSCIVIRWDEFEIRSVAILQLLGVCVQ